MRDKKKKQEYEVAKKREELLETLEKLKEIQRMEFDYFKHLTTLSTGSILVLVAFLEKVFSCPRGEVWALASIGCFALCVIGSLLALPSAGNIVLYTTGIRMVLVSVRAGEEEKAKEDVEKGLEKMNKAFNSMKFYDHFTRIVFFAGLASFLIFAGINFFD